MRLLLAAYPARMRRRHGDELLDTLASMTDGRPSRADRLHLVGDGLRERFRLPARRPLALLTAVGSMLAGGALGLLGASWAGLQMHSPVPAARPLAEQILGPETEPFRVDREQFALAITGAYREAAIEESHARLTDAGWTVSPVEEHYGQGSFEARSGDLTVVVSEFNGEIVQVMGYPVRPASYLPLVLGGLALGLLTGWLTGASLAHRLSASPHRFPSVVVAAIGATLLLVPIGRLYQGLYLYLTGNHHGYGTGKLVHDALAWIPWPLRDTNHFPDTIVPGLRVLTIGLTVVALAAILARRPTPGTSATADAEVPEPAASTSV
jgi:hypothetical protein